MTQSSALGEIDQYQARSLMMAWRVHEFGPPEVMSFEQVPRPIPGVGEVLIKVEAAGVGPWDGWIRAGNSALPQPLPLTLGSDLSGEIASVGPQVSDLSVGDQVYGVTNSRFTGAYAVQFAHGAGLHIVATAGRDDIPFVRELGADTTIDFRTQRFDEQVREVDAVIDLVGGETQQRSFQVLRRGGKLISAVSRPDQTLAQIYGVEAAFFLVSVTTRSLAPIAEMIDAGTLSTHVGATLPLRNAREAHLMLEGIVPRPKGKIVLAVTEGND